MGGCIRCETRDAGAEKWGAVLLGCMTLCEGAGAGAGGRWALGWEGSRGGGASVEEEEEVQEVEEEGVGSNCCLGSGLGKAMAGVGKPTELWLSLLEAAWLSREGGGFSLPGGAGALASALRGGWRRGCGMEPSRAWAGLAPEGAVMPVCWWAGDPVPRTAVLLLFTVAVVAMDKEPTPEGLGSEVNSCFLTEEGVGTPASGLEGAGFGVWGEAAAVGVWLLGAPGLETEAAEGAAPLCSLWAALDRAGPPTPPPLCFGELLALPGLTGLTGKGPQVLAAGEKVPPNWAMGRRGCLIWCMVWAARRASWGWA